VTEEEELPGSGLNQFPFRKGTYIVTKVVCTQKDCMDNMSCNGRDGYCAEIGLQEQDQGCYMICHDYWNEKLLPSQKTEKKVYMQRVV
jgi:hypothetical protein